MSESSYRHAESADALTAHNVRAMRHLDDAAARQQTGADRAASRIANWCGRIQFVWLHVAGFGGWIAFNCLPKLPHFDPYPFTFLVLVVSLEAIFLSTFVLMSQNHEMRTTERRNRLDLQINLLTEQENTKALQLLARIAEKLSIEDASGGLAALDQATRPETLARQIDKAYPEAER